MVTAQNPIQRSCIVSPDIGSAGFNRLCEGFETARIKCPDEYVESYYSLAGKIVRMRIVGQLLASMYERAFAPRILMVASRTPTLTIDLWDESVADVPYPLPLNMDDKSGCRTAEGDWQYVDESGRWVWVEKVEMASWLDQKANHIVGWRAWAEKLPNHERSKPLASLLPWWLYHQGVNVLHAAMMAHNGSGLLITGPSGIGKSTTTLCCMQSGLNALSDDNIAVTPAEGGKFIAHSIYQSVRFYSDELYRFPNLQPYTVINRDPLDLKSLVFLAEAYPGQLLGQAKIGVIALARRSAQPQTRFQRATGADAFKYMWRNSLVTPLGIGRARFEHINQMVVSAPCYWLDLGHDLALIPPIIEQLIQKTS